MDSTNLIQNIVDKHCNSDDLVPKSDSLTQDKSDSMLDICRICMVNDVNMTSLWSEPAEKFDTEFQYIKDILTTFASVLIKDDEHLPDAVCEKCEANIYYMYTFKKKCENAEELLRNLLKRKESQIESNHLQVDRQEETSTESKPNDNVSLNKIIYPCNQCSETFEQRLQLNQHIKTIHKRYKCTECGDDFSQPQILKRHLKIHFGIKNKECNMCGRCFLRADDLKRHIRIHTGEKPFKCDLCPKSYKQSSELVQHKLTHSSVKQFTCKLCDKSLSSRNGYYIHMKVHNGQKNHSCHLCDKTFVTTSERTSHIRYIHMKEKLYECTVLDCSKRFVTQISLNQHVKGHEKKIQKFDASYDTETRITYDCSVCDQQLQSQLKLRKHMKLHARTTDDGCIPVEKYECEICGKKFMAKSTFTKHMTSHTPFTCDMCGASILHYDIYVLHRELHNDNWKDDEDDESSTSTDQKSFD